MHNELSRYAAHLRELINHEPTAITPARFGELALDLFALQFQFNAAFRRICLARGLTPLTVNAWERIPAVPTVAFKEMELSSIPARERATVFHSSGTTGQKPSRHFHHADSLALYETSLKKWFDANLGSRQRCLFLTPSPTEAPHSSLIYMFATLRRERTAAIFCGGLSADDGWTLQIPEIMQQVRSAIEAAEPLTMLGTAFSFVHLLDYLAEQDLRFALPAGSRVMETGGYKNRSRFLPKTELHQLIHDRLGVAGAGLVCEYGMSELSSQAYALAGNLPFHFPPWARAQIVSPESGREVADGQAGLIRVMDLANVYSVAAVQTEDLGVRRGDAFELIGRAEKAEPRGCSLMPVSA